MTVTKKRCCFTGHRPDKVGKNEKFIKEQLRIYIKKAVEDGFFTFITGMALGVDIWAAEIVVEEKENYPEIKLVCASPYPGFGKNRSYADRIKYQFILENADYVINVSDKYTRFCFQIRNMWMVDRSDRVIAVYNGTRGGTHNTIEYAKKKNIQIVNVLSEN